MRNKLFVASCQFVVDGNHAHKLKLFLVFVGEFINLFFSGVECQPDTHVLTLISGYFFRRQCLLSVYYRLDSFKAILGQFSLDLGSLVRFEFDDLHHTLWFSFAYDAGSTRPTTHDAEPLSLKLELLSSDNFVKLFGVVITHYLYEVLLRNVTVASTLDSHGLAEPQQQLLDWVMTDAFKIILFMVIDKLCLVAKSHRKNRVISLLFLNLHIVDHLYPVHDERLQLVIMSIGCSIVHTRSLNHKILVIDLELLRFAIDRLNCWFFS